MIWYAIININEVTPEMLRAANCPKIEHARLNSDGTKCLLKFHKSECGVFHGFDWYSKEEIVNIIDSAEWGNEKSLLSKFLGAIGL
jgi:hypothetical protein